MTNDKSLSDRLQDPKTQVSAALERARFADGPEAAASWAVAAAVFSLRDTVERAMTGPAMVDPGQLTPEEIESIKRGPVGYMPVVEPVFRPAVTREQVAIAIAAGVGKEHIVGMKLDREGVTLLFGKPTTTLVKMIEEPATAEAPGADDTSWGDVDAG